MNGIQYIWLEPTEILVLRPFFNASVEVILYLQSLSKYISTLNLISDKLNNNIIKMKKVYLYVYLTFG